MRAQTASTISGKLASMLLISTVPWWLKRTGFHEALCRLPPPARRGGAPPRQVHRRKPGPVARPLLIDQVLHAARVSAQAAYLVQVRVETFEAEDAPVVDRPGCKPVHLPFVEGQARVSATSAGSRAVARLYRPSSPCAASGASSAAFTSGQTVPAGNSRCRCAPAHLPACENLLARWCWP